MAPRQYRQYQVWAAPVLVGGMALEWFAPLSEPPAYQVEPGLSAAWTQYVTGITVPAPPTDLQNFWFAPLAEPVRIAPSLTTANQQSFATDWQWTAAVPSFGWHQLLSEPVRQKTALLSSAHQFFATDANPIVLADSWHQALAEPVRVKVAVAWQQDLTTDWKWEAPTVIVYPDSWFQQLSEPVQIEPGLSAAWTQYVTGITIPAVFADYNWVTPLSEPVRIKPDVIYRKAFTTDWKWEPPTPTVVEFNWFAALSQPVILEPGLSAAWMQVTSVGSARIELLNHFGALSEPVRVRPDIRYREPFTTDWKWDVPPTDLGRWYWFSPLSEPVRTKPDIVYRKPFTTDWKWEVPSAVTDLRNFWFNPLSEPVRTRPPLRVGQQPFTIDARWLESARDRFWFNWLSEPVRIKPALRVAAQQAFTIDWKVPIPKADSWYRVLSEPVRYRILRTALQQPFTTDWQWTAPVVPTDLRSFWFSPLSEPVRQKQGLRTANQQPFTMDWNWAAPPIIIDLRLFWYNWLAEPVRTPPALWPANQRFISFEAPPVTYSFDLTELGDIGIFSFSTPGLCDNTAVTIHEVWMENMANVTITEVEE